MMSPDAHRRSGYADPRPQQQERQQAESFAALRLWLHANRSNLDAVARDILRRAKR